MHMTLPKLEKENLNRSIRRIEIATISLPSKNNTGPNDFATQV